VVPRQVRVRQKGNVRVSGRGVVEEDGLKAGEGI